MKNMFNKAGASLGLCLLMLLFINVSFGQTPVSPSQNANGKQQTTNLLKPNANQTPTLMAPPTGAPVPVKQGAQFKTTPDANGTVIVPVHNADGSVSTQTFAKPQVQVKPTPGQNPEQAMDQYIKDFKAWMSHNQDFLNYLTEGEKTALNSDGHIGAVYTYNHNLIMEKMHSNPNSKN